MNDLIGNLYSISPLHTGHLVSLARDSVALSGSPDRRHSFGLSSDDPLRHLPVTMNGDIAVVEITGVISASSWWRTSNKELAKTFDTLAQLDNVRACVVMFDTVGGTTKHAAEVADAMDRFRAEKPLIGQVYGGCFSLGVYFASHCDQVYAHRMDTIGNVGTRLMFYDWSQAFKAAGIKPVLIDTGDFKSIGAMGVEVTPEQIAFLQDHVDKLQADFRDSLVAGRKLTDDEYTAVADGRFWLAADAVDLKLIDGIQTTNETLAQLRAQLSDSQGTQTMQTNDTPATETVSENESTDTSQGETSTTTQGVLVGGEQAQADASRTELKRYMDTFGEAAGAKYYSEGVSFSDALAAEHKALREQVEKSNETASEANATLETVAATLGQDTPISTKGDDNAESKADGAFVSAIKLPA